jgi:hypothetical protein
MEAKNKEHEQQVIQNDFLKIENEGLKQMNDELKSINETQKEVAKEMIEYFDGFKSEMNEWIKLAKTDGMNDFAKMEQMKRLMSRVNTYLTKGHFVKANKTMEKVEYHMEKIQSKLIEQSDKEEQLASTKKAKDIELAEQHRKRDQKYEELNKGKKTHQEITKITPNKINKSPKPTFKP